MSTAYPQSASERFARAAAAAEGAGAGVVRVDAAGAADGSGLGLAPASVLLEVTGVQRDARWPAWPGARVRVLAVGRPGDVDAHEAAGAAERVDLGRHVLIPGLVNAHTHLDLTHLGPLEHEPGDGFVSWIERVRTGRRSEGAEIEASVREGVGLLLKGGCVAVGDIAGAPGGRPSLAAWRVLRDGPLAGVSYLEFFAIGRGVGRGCGAAGAALAEAGEEVAKWQSGRVAKWGESDRATEGRSDGGVRLGLQPHAPNTVEPEGYRWALGEARRRGMRVCTHLAESPEEREFLAEGTGPQRELLEGLGLWEERLEGVFGRGRGAIEHVYAEVGMDVRELVEGRPGAFAAVHVNGCGEGDIERLAEMGAAVVYCPRASAYFGFDRALGPHRYREMLGAGVEVALGTDSILNLPAGEVERGGMGVLDELRLLHRRDGTDGRTLLAMGTAAGARVLGLDERGFVIGEGATLAGLVGVETGPVGGDPIRAVVQCDGRPELLFYGIDSRSARSGPLG